MAITDTSVVQYLLGATREGQAIGWREREWEGFAAQIRGLELELESVPTRVGAKIHLTLSSGGDSVQIVEPPRRGVFSQRFASEEQRHLAHLLRELWALVDRQCAARRNRSPEELERLRESLYERLVSR